MLKRIESAYAMTAAIIICRKEILHRLVDHIVMNDVFMAVAVGAGAYAMAQMTSLALTGRWL